MKTEESRKETAATDLLKRLAYGGEDDAEKQRENKHVGLEMGDVNTDGTNPQKVRRFGRRHQTSVLTDSSSSGAQRVTEPNLLMAKKTKRETEKKIDSGAGKCTEGDNGDPADPPSSLDRPCPRSEDCIELGDQSECAMTQPAVPKEDQYPARDEELRDSDHGLSGRSVSDDHEEDDDVVLLLSDECIPCVTEDDSRYITTHEIQLSELSDHDSNPEVGSSTSWDLEDDNQVYSFVDYSLVEGAAGRRGGARQPRAHGKPAAVSTLLESDPCDAAKLTSSDESMSKQPWQQQRRATSGGQIHLSITTTSRAINDRSNTQEQGNILYHATRSGDVSHCVIRGVGGRAETLRDGAKCLIAAPGLRLRGREVTGLSSGASSAVSNLDEADKEVRSLTARAFKSLAYPCAFNLSTSSESSASERGIGISSLSALVDLKYGNMHLPQGLDRGLVPHQNPAAHFRNADSRYYQGFGPASINPPTSKIFALNASPQGTALSTKKIELMGEFGQGHSGVIKLTETLNFRCNVKLGMPGGERRANFTQSAPGSYSRDEVTDTLPGGQRRAAPQPPPKAMEDTHKKAIFASSLIKNVISKKIQFEQERKMERGEIMEPHRAPSPSCAHPEGDCLRGREGREMHRQSSRSSSDCAVMTVEESGEIVDSGSCRQDADGRAPDTDPEPADEAGIETKTGALEASKSTLPRSQNSAFRCWKDEGLEFQKDRKKHYSGQKSPPASGAEREVDRSSPSCGKLTKMARLFLPSIQVSAERAGEQPHNRGHSPCGDTEGPRLRSDNTLYVIHSSSKATSKSPEIKINLRSVRNNQTEPFGVPKLCTPNIVGNTVSRTRTDDVTCQALAAALRGESSDKVPHFTVRDVRDSKAKLHTPIHQVRDVRKLVKSSYHFVSLDSNENKSSADGQEPKKQIPHRNPASVSPIVIKCQSVNTNNNDRQSGSRTKLHQTERLDADGCSLEGAERTAGRPPIAGPSLGALRGSEPTIPGKRLDKTPDMSEKKADLQLTNRVALEKLQAAVRTMEQLYVFDRKEWRRRAEPRPLTASCQQGCLGEGGAGGSNMDRTPPAVVVSPGADSPKRREDKLFQAAGGREVRLVAMSPQTTTSSTGSSLVSSSSPKAQQNLSEGPSNCQEQNYLTIPVQAPSRQAAGRASAATQTPPTAPAGQVGPGRKQEDLLSSKSSSTETGIRSPETLSTTFYHPFPLGLTTSQPQVYCFSPAITPTPSLDPYHFAQRKMLLDPTTGNYYLVDAPVQPATRRLFDPETGQYVNLPVPQPTASPVPLQISALALNPGTYGHTYMIYPGFMPAPPVVPARTQVQSQMSVQLEAAGEEKASPQQAEGLYMEGPFYMATVRGPQGPLGDPQQASLSIQQPVISITTQQGPRIIAPPSFDGTTMNVVVEHR